VLTVASNKDRFRERRRMGAVYLLLQNNLIMVRVPLQLAGGGDVRRAVADRAY
jgi:hypothetical protein